MVGRNPSAEPATPCHRDAAPGQRQLISSLVRNANTLGATVFTGALVLGLAGASAPAGEPLNPGHLLYDEAQRRLIMLAAYPPPELPEDAELREWRTTGWTLLPATSGPSMRTLSAAVHDSRRKRIVMYGDVGMAPRSMDAGARAQRGTVKSRGLHGSPSLMGQVVRAGAVA